MTLREPGKQSTEQEPGKNSFTSNIYTGYLIITTEDKKTRDNVLTVSEVINHHGD